MTRTRTAVPPPTSRPHVVVVLVDDLDVVTSPFWDAMPQTARLIRDRGKQFTRASAPDPVCCPARSILLTGLYAHNTGVLTNEGDQGGRDDFVAGGNEERTFPLALQEAGYSTAPRTCPTREGVIITS